MVSELHLKHKIFGSQIAKGFKFTKSQTKPLFIRNLPEYRPNQQSYEAEKPAKFPHNSQFSIPIGLTLVQEGR